MCARRERTVWTLCAWSVNPEAGVCVLLVNRLDGVLGGMEPGSRCMCVAGMDRHDGVCVAGVN